MRIGFVVEGDCEKLLIESANFRTWATQQGLEICDPVINAWGNGNLCNKQIEVWIKKCFSEAKPDKIVVLTDLECDPCVTQVKQRIGNQRVAKVFVAKKALEAWFLADTQAMNKWLGQNDFVETHPESTPEMPWQRLKQIVHELRQQSIKVRGPGDKLPFTKKMLKDFGFSIERAANHPQCSSAKYFLENLPNI